MDGENLRDGCMEVAFEQWTEPGQQDLDDSSVENKDAPGSRLQRHSPVTGNGIGADRPAERRERSRTGRVQRGKISEFRW